MDKKRGTTYGDTSRDVDTKGQTKTPAERHGEPRVVGREDELGNGAGAEGNEDGSAQELGESLAELLFHVTRGK